MPPRTLPSPQPATALSVFFAGSQFLEPDGWFPNHVPNPEDATAMAAGVHAVQQSSSDLGVVLDTDVDRSAVVARDGQPINSNRYIALMSLITLRSVLRRVHGFFHKAHPYTALLPSPTAGDSPAAAPVTDLSSFQETLLLYCDHDLVSSQDTVSCTKTLTPSPLLMAASPPRHLFPSPEELC